MIMREGEEEEEEEEEEGGGGLAWMIYFR